MRAVKIGMDLLAEQHGKRDLAQAKTDEAAMSCRRHTLEVRDRLLADLPPAGATALTGWVEARKAGMKITLRKSAIQAFRLPE